MVGPLRWYKRRRLKNTPIPASWLKHIKKHLPAHACFSEAEREIFFEKLKIFLDEKRFIGARDTEVTEEMRVVIAAEAVRVILHLDISHYDRLHEIIVYPYDYKRPDSDEEFAGEVDEWSVLVLSWPAVLEGLEDPSDGYNPIVHEFAHVLDRATGTFDGTPRLHKRADYKAWAEVLSRHYLKLQKNGRAQRDVLDEYGAENEAEFFAVATESFFELPADLKARTPDLYGELRKFFGYEPPQLDLE